MRASRRRKYWNLLREITVAQYRSKDQHTFFGFAWGVCIGAGFTIM